MAPGPLEHLVCGPVEVDAVDRLRADAHAVGALGGGLFLVRRLGQLAGQEGAAGEVNGSLLALRQRASPDEAAVRHQRAVASVAGQHLQLERAGLVAVELERSHQLDVLKRRDVPSGHQRGRRLREPLDPHYAWKNRDALDPVVVEEGLVGRIQLGQDGESVAEAEA